MENDTSMNVKNFAMRKEVLSTCHSQINMLQTIENIPSIPPMNQLDLTAELMLDCFTNQPDFTPYNFVKNNIPLDRLNSSLDNLLGAQLYWAKKSLGQDLDDADRIDDDGFDRIIWHAVKGYDRPYPVIIRSEEK